MVFIILVRPLPFIEPRSPEPRANPANGLAKAPTVREAAPAIIFDVPTALLESTNLLFAVAFSKTSNASISPLPD